MDFERGVVVQVDEIGNGGGRLNDGDATFPLQSFLNDVHMEQAEEAAAKSEAEGFGMLNFKRETGVIEMESFDRLAEPFEVTTFSVFGAS